MFFIGGFAVALFGLWGLARYFGTKGEGSPNEPSVQYVVQEKGILILQEHQLQQIAWRDPWLWRSETLLGVQDDKLMYVIPRRFCRDSRGWDELTAHLSERLENSDVQTADDYDGSGPYDEFDHRTRWALEIAAPVTAVSHSPVAAEELLRWEQERRSRIPLGLAMGIIATSALIVWLLPSGAVRSFLFGVGAVVVLLAASVGSSERSRRKGVVLHAQEHPTHYVVRQACVELVSTLGRRVFHWDDMRRYESDENRIVLVVEGVAVSILLQRRQFSESDWNRLREQVSKLPDGKARKSSSEQATELRKQKE